MEKTHYRNLSAFLLLHLVDVHSDRYLQIYIDHGEKIGKRPNV